MKFGMKMYVEVENQTDWESWGKSMSELFQGEFCKDENLKFFYLQFHNLSYTPRQTTRKQDKIHFSKFQKVSP